jgi:ribosome maturation factor RimP
LEDNRVITIFATEIRNRKKGTGLFPSAFYSTMSNENQISTVEKLLLPLLTDDIFLIEIKVKPINNIKIFLDADGGLGIEKCIKINRALYKMMEEMGIYPDGDFSLEVSSPGIGEPLKKVRQYHKNKGRDVEVITTDERTITGPMQEVTEENITVVTSEGKGKKLVVKEEVIPFEIIKQTKVLIKF